MTTNEIPAELYREHNYAYVTPRAMTERLSEARVSFGVRDAKGRDVGATAIVWTETYRLGPLKQYVAEYRAWNGETRQFVVIEGTDRPCGIRYWGNVHQTRDGKNFGGACSSRDFASQIEAEAFVATKLAESKERARKKYS